MRDKTVLAVDDEDGIRFLLEMMLSQLGCTVLTASNGNEALQVVRQHEGKIDLLVTDVKMPGMSGHQLAKTLLAVLPGLKVLLVSGYPDGTAVLDCVERAEFPFLPKPFTLAALTDTVRQVLSAPAAL